ncbi:sugar phosphate isomerase/epimerase family protein [Parablautia muri]|uniref:Sugar phosphate isomerase/epimerase n=1 Tax=Parablautia muri TaxID=2320879 RepID=A0A9X5BH63_9FIRM|nr:sugar phosphate isomerase/epimerase [Parablautia muri]NBJ93614.1 sugar phosphate isomerase/epimerase [Parablautia muri]
MNLPVAAQMYSVREEAAADFDKTMQQLADMGYDGVELAGLYGKSAKEIRSSLEKAGLQAISAHVPMVEFEQDLDKTVETYKEIGCKYVAIPYLDKERWYGGSRYQDTLDMMVRISEKCREAGMVLLYHNHNFEFEKTEQGDYQLDILYETIPADVLQTELDLCWVKVGGADPVTYLKKYKGRCPLVHVKDFIRKDGEVVLVAVGDGEVSADAVVPAAVESGANWLVIEQDSHTFGTPMENMEKSLKCVKTK